MGKQNYSVPLQPNLGDERVKKVGFQDAPRNSLQAKRSAVKSYFPRGNVRALKTEGLACLHPAPDETRQVGPPWATAVSWERWMRRAPSGDGRARKLGVRAAGKKQSPSSSQGFLVTT